MAPRKAARARSRRASPKPSDPVQVGRLISVGGFGDIPLIVRKQMIKELQALDGGGDMLVPPPSDVSPGCSVAAAETRGQALINRMSRLVDELGNIADTMEAGVRKISGPWPWPEVEPVGVDPEDFHGMLEHRLDRLAAILRHAGATAQRLHDIA